MASRSSDEVGDGDAVGVADAEIAAEETGDPACEARRDRPVEAVFGAQGGERLRRRLQAEHHGGGVARQDLEHDEDDQRRGEKRDDEADDAADDEGEHLGRRRVLPTAARTAPPDRIGRQRPVLPHAVEIRVPRADLRQLEQEDVDRILRQHALRVAIEPVALRLVGGRVDLRHQRLEGRVLVLEVIVVARIDADVERLGMRDDAQVVILVAEDLVEPLREFDRLDRRPHADLGEHRRDDLAGAPRIRRRRQAQGRGEAVGEAGLAQQGARLRGVVRIQCRSGRHRPDDWARNGCRSACRKPDTAPSITALRSIAWASARRTRTSLKGGLPLLIATIVSPSVLPTTTLSFWSALSCSAASCAARFDSASTSPARIAETCACASGMNRNVARLMAGTLPQ